MESVVLGGICAIAVALAGLVILALIVRGRGQRRRHEELARWAAAHGWTVTPNPTVDWGARLPGGNRKGISLALSAVVNGRPVSVGEYSYTETHITGGGADGATTTTSHTHRFVVAVVRLNQSYQPVAVRPRSALSKLAVRGDERFDRQFTVEAADPAYARRLIGPALAAEHVAGTVPPWSLHGTELLAYRKGRLDAPDQIPGLVSPLIRVADLLGR